MNLLALSTASTHTSFALIHGDEVKFERTWEASNNEAKTLLPQIEKAFIEEEAVLSNLDGVVAVKGPGSFTGLRVGVTLANTMAEFLGVKRFALDTFTFWEAACSQKEGVLFVKAGKREVYKKTVGAPIETVEIVLIDEVEVDDEVRHAWGDLLPGQRDQLCLLLPSSVEWIEQGRLFTFGETILNAPLEEVPEILPLYIKQPGITPSKKSFLTS